jgi:hypothetical protein
MHYLLLQELSVFLLNVGVLQSASTSAPGAFKHRRMQTYVSPSRSTPLLRLIEGICSNLLWARRSEPLAPSRPESRTRFGFLSRSRRSAREGLPRERFVGMIEVAVTRMTLFILSYLISSWIATWPQQSSQQRRSMTPSYAPDADGLSPHTVLLGEGLPTKEELLVYYPAKFTWRQLKTFVNSGYFYMLYL